MTVKLKDRLRIISLQLRVIALTIIWVLAQSSSVVQAADGEREFTDIFSSVALSGNWEFLSKVNFLGWIMSTAISVVSVFGLFLVIMQMLVTMLVLTNKSFFKYVHNLKESDDLQGKGAAALNLFGILPAWKNIATGQAARKPKGIDAILAILISLLPDLWLYSEYYKENDGDELDHHLNEKTDTIASYLFKVSLSKIVTIWVLSMGWKGTLWQAYASVVDGMGAASEQFVALQLDQYVDDFFKTGVRYQFTFSSSGTSFGKFQQKLAQDLYNRILSTVDTTSLDSDDIRQIGLNVESYVLTNFTVSNINKALSMDVQDNAFNQEASSLVESVQILWKSSGMKKKIVTSSKTDDGANTSGSSSNAESEVTNGQINVDNGVVNGSGNSDSNNDASKSQAETQIEVTDVKSSAERAGQDGGYSWSFIADLDDIIDVRERDSNGLAKEDGSYVVKFNLSKKKKSSLPDMWAPKETPKSTPTPTPGA